MTRSRSLTVAIALAATLVPSGVAAAGLFAPAGATPHPAVCRVAVEERDGQAFGSGTLIDARDQYGLVVTNWHVVRDATGKIEVRFPSGATSEARPLKLDETWDLAALVIWRPPTEPAPLAMTPPRAGDRLTICGYGQGDYRAQTGRCTDYYSPEVGLPQELVELDVEARQGDSGGPIFNDRGELAGVLFGAAQGTTLGSFGGRVQTFLATLAPNIGAAPQAEPRRAASLLAQSPHAQGAFSTALNSGLSRGRLPAASEPPQAAIDPFQLAELRASDSGRLRPIESPHAPLEASNASPPPALTDLNSAPRLAASRHSADAWRPAPAPPTAPPRTAVAGARQAEAIPPVAAAFSRPPALATASPDQPAGDELAEGATVDWSEDGRTLLALVGVAALVVTGLRSLG